MAYAVLADIQAEFKSVTFSSGSAPTDSSVTGFITQAEAEINARLGLKYTVPIDSSASPNSFQIVKMLSIQSVAARVARILRVKTADDGKSQDTGPQALSKEVKAKIDEILNGIFPLPDAVLKSSLDGVESFAVDNSQQTVFQKDTDNW